METTRLPLGHPTPPEAEAAQSSTVTPHAAPPRAPDAEPATFGTLTVRTAHVNDIAEVLALHRFAFADKFGSAFGAGQAALDRGVAALALAWSHKGGRMLRGMLVAERDGVVVGTLTLRTWEMGDGESETIEYAFQQVLGLWGTMRSLFVLSLLTHRVGRFEGYITDVAVHQQYRRQGVAQALLAVAERTARQQRRHYLGLYVSNSNTGAHRLYEQAGFHVARVQKSWMTRLLFGQRNWLYMRKNLELP